jgi:hypothetical protein
LSQDRFAARAEESDSKALVIKDPLFLTMLVFLNARHNRSVMVSSEIPVS